MHQIINETDAIPILLILCRDRVLQRIADNDQEFVEARNMLLELHKDNQALVERMRAAHEVAAAANDYATTSLIEVWIDEAERRVWFLFEASW